MKDSLITLDTAKLLVDKQILVKCDNIYVKDKVEWYYDEYNYENDIIFFAPTQSLLQKLLREKYNLLVLVYPDDVKWYCVVGTHEKDDPVFQTESIYNKYEDALEVGLNKAIKLIK